MLKLNSLKNKLLFLFGLFFISICLVRIFGHFQEKDWEKAPSFYEENVDVRVNEDLKIGYLFTIGNKTYKPGTYQYEIKAKANDKRINFLSEENSNYQNKISFSWRQAKPPFQVIKKSKADTLYIIKRGRTFAFTKYFETK